jgi:hypothetical protein
MERSAGALIWITTLRNHETVRLALAEGEPKYGNLEAGGEGNDDGTLMGKGQFVNLAGSVVTGNCLRWIQPNPFDQVDKAGVIA